MKWLVSVFALLCATLGLAAAPAEAASPYAVNGRCSGLPRIFLTTGPGTCVGLVGSGLDFPRGIAEHDGDFYITDMGSWLPHRGRLLRVRLDQPWKPVVVLPRLDRPGAIVTGADGYIYIAESTRIIRINPYARDVAGSVQPVVTGLPGTGLHSLPGLALARAGGLFISLGAASDNCENRNGRGPNANPCPELSASPPRGSILFLPPRSPRPMAASALGIYATGIRNTLAMTQLPNGLLLAAANGRDNIDSADPRLSDDLLPHDLLLGVTQNSRFGWPYCFDLDRPSPEYRAARCATFARPAMLLPPHAAPLSMLAYRGKLTRGPSLIIAYHGYRAAGHRIVAFATDPQGLPTGSPVDLVSGWDPLTRIRPQGSPIAMLPLADGSILILEDHNGTLLRLTAR
jgi:glucose/arabinose dehydrogenase